MGSRIKKLLILLIMVLGVVLFASEEKNYLLVKRKKLPMK